MKVKVKVGRCSIFVEGMEMKCPLCNVLVESGQSHECTIDEKEEIVPAASDAPRRASGEK